MQAENGVAGWLSFHPFMPRCAYRATAEVSVYVHPDFRQRGVARVPVSDIVIVGRNLQGEFLFDPKSR